MTRHRLLRKRTLGSLWLAAAAALCLLTFSGSPHPSSVAAGSSGPAPASTAAAHLVATQSSDLVTRAVTRAASPAAHHLGFPSSAVAGSAGLLLLGGWFVLLVRNQRRRVVSRQYGPAAARAPPLVA
jgi:hypothetical protein